MYDSLERLRRYLAPPVPNEYTERYAALCRKFGCYIQTGSFLEADPDFPEAVFNTTALIGPGGLLSNYRKVNPWLPWELHASPHDLMRSQLRSQAYDYISREGLPPAAGHPLTQESIDARITAAKKRLD